MKLKQIQLDELRLLREQFDLEALAEQWDDTDTNEAVKGLYSQYLDEFDEVVGYLREHGMFASDLKQDDAPAQRLSAAAEVLVDYDGDGFEIIVPQDNKGIVTHITLCRYVFSVRETTCYSKYKNGCVIKGGRDLCQMPDGDGWIVVPHSHADSPDLLLCWQRVFGGHDSLIMEYVMLRDEEAEHSHEYVYPETWEEFRRRIEGTEKELMKLGLLEWASSVWADRANARINRREYLTKLAETADQRHPAKHELSESRPENVLNISQLSQLLGSDSSELLANIERGFLPAKKTGDQWVVAENELFVVKAMLSDVQGGELMTPWKQFGIYGISEYRYTQSGSGEEKRGTLIHNGLELKWMPGKPAWGAIVALYEEAHPYWSGETIDWYISRDIDGKNKVLDWEDGESKMQDWVRLLEYVIESRSKYTHHYNFDTDIPF